MSSPRDAGFILGASCGLIVSARGSVSGRSTDPPAKARPACKGRVSIEWSDKNCGEGTPYVTVPLMTHVLIG